MKREELLRLIQGPIATVPTPFDASYALDLGVMRELTQWLVSNGVVAGRSVIKVAAAMGEGPDMNDAEWPRLLKTVTTSAGGRAAIVCGLKTKNTLHTIEDAKQASDLGAIGVQIELPMFHHPTQDDIVRYFTDISNAIDIGIVLYNTYWFGAPSVTVDTMKRLADAENVVAIKWDVPEGADYDQMLEFSSHVNVIDNSNQVVRCHRNGGRGYVNQTMAAWPAHDLEVWDLVQSGRYEEAQALLDRVTMPLVRFASRVGQRSGGYNVPKALLAVMGRPVGPPRPPTLPLNEQEMAELRELVASFGWPTAAGMSARVSG